MVDTKLVNPLGLRSVVVQSIGIRLVQLLRSCQSYPLTSTSCVTSAPSLRRHLQRQWRTTSRLLVVLVFICCCWTHVAVALTTAKKQHDNAMATASDLYIVLVSIPVLDKMLPLKHLAETLLTRGVRVGFALPETARQWVNDLEGLELISLGNIAGKGQATAVDPTEFQRLGVYESYANTLRYYASFQRPMFDILVETLEADRPDLVVVDRDTFAGFDVCHRLQVPYVVNNPHLLFDIDSPPAYIPAPFSNLTMHTTSVVERCLNSYYRLRFQLGLVNAYKEMNAMRLSHGLEAIDTKHEMHSHALVLVNSVFGLDEARPMMPQFRMVGLLQSQKLQLERAEAANGATGRSRFPAALTTWLRAPEHQGKPVIFVSFPLNVPLTSVFITTIMNALETVDAILLWKATLQEQAALDLRSRPQDSVFFLSQGLDDAAVLALTPEIELLITAGESQSIQEALVVGVPILGLPHSAEHLEIVNAVVRAGAGLHLDGKSFSASGLRLAVDRLLLDERDHFQTYAEYLGKLIKSGGGTERAVDELLTVAAFGSRHLLPRRNLQPLYKTYLVDVYLVYGAILCGAAIIVRTFVSVVRSLFQPLTPLEVLEAEEFANKNRLSRAPRVAHKTMQ